MQPTNCYLIGRGDRDEGFVELRRVNFISSGGGDVEGADNLKDSVVVLREGLTLPKISLIDLVNTVYVVLVVRGIPNTSGSCHGGGGGGGGGSGGRGYYYLYNDFALTAEEEDSVVEWGIGRRLYAGALLAVGGPLLVAHAEQVS